MAAGPAGSDASKALAAAARRHIAGDLHSAERVYRRVLAEIPDDPVALFALGGLLHQKGREHYDEALGLIERSLALDPTNPKSQYGYGALLMALDHAEEAVAAYRRAIELGPLYAASYNGIGVPLIDLGRTDELVALYDQALNKYPDLELEHTGRFRNYQSDAIGRGIPPILFATMPKSGSIYIANRLVNAFAAPFCRISLNLFPVDPIIPSWLAAFALGGAVCQEHLDASPRNLELLQRHGVTRLIVHVRDPRQATLSWTHHVETLTEDAAFLRRRLAPSLPADYDGLSFSRKLDWQIGRHLPLLMEWLTPWVAMVDDAAQGLAVLFTRYEAFRRSEDDFFAELRRFYGIENADFAANPADLTSERFHFRKGRTDEWREVFSEAQRDAAWTRMPSRLNERFGWLR